MRKPLILLVWLVVGIAASAAGHKNLDNDIIFDEAPPSESELPIYKKVLSRIKRGLFDFFNSEESGTTEKEDTTTTEDSLDFKESIPTSPTLGVTIDASSRHTRAPEDEESNFPLKGFTSDDEDGHLDYSSGSGESPGVLTDFSTTEQSPDSQRRGFYRMSLLVEEPYSEDFKDESTNRFQSFVSKLQEDIDAYYEPLPGQQVSKVTKIENNGTFFVGVTIDLESEGNTDKDQLKDHILNAIENNRIGNYVVRREGFTFNRFKDCDDNEILCTTSELCVPSSVRCDGTNDCPDDEDELGCIFHFKPKSPPASTTTSSTTTSSTTTPSTTTPSTTTSSTTTSSATTSSTASRTSYINVGVGTPLIKSSEIPFPTSSEEPCRGDDEKKNCPNHPSKKICSNKFCNGVPDCPDGYDESVKECGCRREEFMCDQPPRCILLNQICDEKIDCLDGADEHPKNPRCPKPCDPNIQFSCDGQCFPIAVQCNGYPDCQNGSDEDNCPTKPSDCLNGEFQCLNGACINSIFQCDNIMDCLDGSDELNCNRTGRCHSGQFDCGSNNCVSLSNKCDGQWDCPNGEDERNCQLTCRPLEFQCHSGECVPGDRLCDGNQDCQDNSDEGPSCGGTHFQLPDVKIYGREQIIKEGREAVFQCRDEGPTRYRVKWSRENALPFPTGYRDYQGRLELPNVQRADSGIYICEAIGASPNLPGARDSANLTVEQFVLPTASPGKVCESDEATCDNQQCILKIQVCDGQRNCIDGSDEDRCIRPCEPNEFRCNNKKCILKTWECDSVDDCGDGSDEIGCKKNQPGSQCLIAEYECLSKNQCIPKSFQCDGTYDCTDQSDEQNCRQVTIDITTIPPNLDLCPGQTLVLTCRATGIPVPVISWRRNWKHVPSKCTQTSNNGFGTLTCPYATYQDSGAYTCEAITSHNYTISPRDTIVVVKKCDVCGPSTFNDEATRPEDCIPCFCFGRSTTCRSADLFVYQLPPPIEGLTIVNVYISPTRIDINDNAISTSIQSTLRRTPNSVITNYWKTGNSIDDLDVFPYYAVSEKYHGAHLKSFGGYLRYKIQVDRVDHSLNIPDIIVMGNNRVLTYRHPHFILDNSLTEISARFFEGAGWNLLTPSGEVPALRSDIMMTLLNIQNVLLRIYYSSDQGSATTLSAFTFDSAKYTNANLGKANYVEECQCPPGYDGLSCEHQQNCPPGHYRDPSTGNQCAKCPCPLTTPPNQFSQECYLDSNNAVKCRCPPGYRGDRCQFCDSGYEGNPLIPGDSCRLKPQCNPAGTQNILPNGQCSCKVFTTGPYCSECKSNTFGLAPNNQFGCIDCFCGGLSRNCSSSRLYRNQIQSVFVRSNEGFKIALEDNKIQAFDPYMKEDYIYFDTFEPKVYYWVLPDQFLKNQLTAYGGSLTYKLSYEPYPGGLSSKNNAADVKLFGRNRINLYYYNNVTVVPNQELTISIPLLEQYWKREDGGESSRAQLLMALADLEAILIKATYTTTTSRASLHYVSLETASPFAGNRVALEVEECDCPDGYQGLSCESCKEGYKRSNEGLYFGTCELCECNGRSTTCHPETGECTNCRDNWSGPNCDFCRPGYTEQNGRCVTDRCDCERSGVIRQDCPYGYCECKVNVEGSRCDRCKAGSFFLTPNNPQGCSDCYCSGVTNICQSSNLYYELSPLSILNANNNNGIVLTDRLGKVIEKDNFIVNPARNEIGFEINQNGNEYYWALPHQFNGDKVTSYGGKLIFTRRFELARYGNVQEDPDVIIYGKGKYIYWQNNIPQGSPGTEITESLEVSLKEGEWKSLNPRTGHSSVTRPEFIDVLSDVSSILIRANSGSDILRTYLSDVAIDVGISQRGPTSKKALGVESCNCPNGYEGTSCQKCKKHYYRGDDDRCHSCECYGNEESCYLDSNKELQCICTQEYEGKQCSQRIMTGPPHNQTIPNIPIEINIIESDPSILIKAVGSTVRYTCSAINKIPGAQVSLSWSKYQGMLPDRARDDFRGNLEIIELRESDSGIYICTAFNGNATLTMSVSLKVGSNEIAPSIQIDPLRVDVYEYQRAEVTCTARGSPLPTVQWHRIDNGILSQNATVIDGHLIIPYAVKSDEGTYECVARNSVGSMTGTAFISVLPVVPPPQSYITPENSTVRIGETLTLTCYVSGSTYDFEYDWRREDGRFNSGRINGNRLVFTSIRYEDDGRYICTIRSRSTGRIVGQAIAYISIIPGSSFSGSVFPDFQTVPQGQTAELVCNIPSNNYPGQDKVVWQKSGGSISQRAEYLDNGRTLRIPQLEISDRGVYVCWSAYGGRNANPGTLEVTRQEAPSIELDPQSDRHVLLVGESLALDCRVNGYPAPTVRWTKGDNDLFSNNLVLSRSNTRLTFNQVALSDAGRYTCTASNVAGEDTESTYIEILAPPEIHIYPSDSISLRAGDNLELICEADGSPTPKVEWTKQNPSIHNSFGDLNSNDIISNPNDRRAEYKVLRVSSEDEGYYYCIASNSARTEYKVAQVIVENFENPPFSPDDPTSYTTIPAGGNIEISCSIDTNRNINRKWIRVDRNPFPNGVHEREGILYIRSATQNVDGEYACVTYDSEGNIEKRISRIIKVIEVPEITLHPVTQVVRPGDNAQIICNATGSEPITITWEANRPPSRHIEISGNVLRFRGITENDEGSYICKARNNAGLRQAAALVTVNDGVPRVRVFGPQSRSSVQGSNATLQCESDYSNNMTWTFNGGGLPPNAIIQGSTLIIRDVDHYLNSGQYTCTVFSPSGSYNSDYIQLTVTQEQKCSGGFLCKSGQCINSDGYCNNSTDCDDGSDEADCQRIRRGAVNIRLKIEPSIDIIRVGSTVDLRCITEGIPISKIEWKKLNEPSLGPNVHTISASVLRIEDVTTSNAGPYRCSAQTDSQMYTDEYILNVQDNFDATPAPPLAAKTIHLKAGDTVDITCSNDLEPPVTYTWLKQGGIPATANEQQGKLTLNKITPQDAGLYTCVATNGEVKMEIPTFIVIQGIIPRFSSDSYVKLKTLFDAYMQFDIEILFKPEDPHGLILYNGHHPSTSGGKDFVSFGLRNGYPEFKFDMGSGPASIVGRSPLPMGKWTKAKLYRNRKEGQLIINDEEPIIGTSQGRHQGLDLDLPLYVGSVPDFNTISKSTNLNSGFTGCISRLVIKNEEQNLTRKGSLEWVGISDCESCSVNTCTNSGACQEAPNTRGYICLCPRGFSGDNCDRTGESCYPGLCGDGYCENTQKGYICKCPLGLIGDNCEHRIKIRTPSFDDKSYMAYTVPKDTAKIDVSIKLNPSDSRDALILYAAQNDFGIGNYISLAIKDRRFEFRFDTGAGVPMVLTSNSEVIPGSWITITAGRDLREARLSVGNDIARTTLTSGQRHDLTLGTFLYLGGFDYSTGSVNVNVGVSDGFRGCISHIDISKTDIDILKSTKESSNIGECPTGNPCRESPCQNGASCIPDGGSYTCACTPDYSGYNCEKLKNVCERYEPCQGKGQCIPVLNTYKCQCTKGFSGQNCTIREHFTTSFSIEGDGWVEMPRDIMADVGDETEIEMSIVTHASDGILLWHGQGPTLAGGVTDFFSIAVVSGHVEVVFELGSGVGSVVEHDIRVDDGITHRIHVSRKGNYAILSVDHKTTEGVSEGFLSKLNANGNVYIGGLPDPMFMTNGRYLENFNGCIRNVIVQNSDIIDVSHMAISTVNVRKCPVPEE